jgi:hypothetical protein
MRSHDLSTTSLQFQASIDRQEYTHILLNSYEPRATPRRLLKVNTHRTDPEPLLGANNHHNGSLTEGGGGPHKPKRLGRVARDDKDCFNEDRSMGVYQSIK